MSPNPSWKSSKALSIVREIPILEVEIINTTSGGSSQLGEFLFMGVVEIIGREGVNAVFNPMQSSRGSGCRGVIDARDGRVGFADFPDLSVAMAGLEKWYGPTGGRGIALRAGRSGFRYLLRQKGVDMGITGSHFNLLPVPVRLKTGMDALAGLLSNMTGDVVFTAQDQRRWTWESKGCPFCKGRVSHDPVCHFTVGLLQEYFSWASGGKIYLVDETACRASGAPACLVTIDKKPLD